MRFSFNPLDPKTWSKAKNSQLVWSGIDLYDNEKGFITEAYFTKVMQFFFEQPGNSFLTDEKRGEAAKQVIDSLKKHNSFIPQFFPLEPDTWNNASEQQMIWDGVALYTQKTEPLTQIQFVELFNAAFAFHGRNGEIFTDEQKSQAAEKIGTRMAKYNSLFAIEHPECLESEPVDHGFHEKVTSSPEVLRAIDKMNRREDAWGDACKQAETEYRTKGARKLNDSTPGYLDRINEIYNSSLPRYMSPDYKIRKREVIEYNFDQPFEDENGNYIFLQEQLEYFQESEEITPEILFQIGKVILDSKKEYGHAGWHTQQELFDTFGHLNCDWEFIVKLDGARGFPGTIKQLVHDYRTCEDEEQ